MLSYDQPSLSTGTYPVGATGPWDFHIEAGLLKVTVTCSELLYPGFVRLLLLILLAMGPISLSLYVPYMPNYSEIYLFHADDLQLYASGH